MYMCVTFNLHNLLSAPKRTKKTPPICTIFSENNNNRSHVRYIVCVVCRYIFIEYPRHSAVWCTINRAKTSVVIVYFVMFLVCLPNFALTTIGPYTSPPPTSSSNCSSASSASSSCNVVGGVTAPSGVQSRPSSPSTDPDALMTLSSTTKSSTPGDLTTTSTSACCLVPDNSADDNDVIWSVTLRDDIPGLGSLNFWIQALVVKLIPCGGLAVLSALLIRALRQADQRRRLLRGREGRCDRRCKANSRTTRMLLCVVVLFLITELPQGIVHLLNGLLHGFFDDIYISLGDLLDILALVNNGVNFILYCTMSKLFRDTFVQLFVRNRCCRRQARRVLVSRLICLNDLVRCADDDTTLATGAAAIVARRGGGGGPVTSSTMPMRVFTPGTVVLLRPSCVSSTGMQSGQHPGRHHHQQQQQPQFNCHLQRTSTTTVDIMSCARQTTITTTTAGNTNAANVNTGCTARIL